MQCTCVYYDVGEWSHDVGEWSHDVGEWSHDVGEWSHVYYYVVVCPQSCGMSDLANYAFAASPTHHTS